MKEALEASAATNPEVRVGTRLSLRINAADIAVVGPVSSRKHSEQSNHPTSCINKLFGRDLM